MRSIFARPSRRFAVIAAMAGVILAGMAGCAGGVEVILCTKEGGREEPGDATIAWPVLSRHTL